MQVSLTYTGGEDGASWQGLTPSGHTLTLDGSEEVGGQNKGPRPMELVLLGLGGCSAMDVLHILRKGRSEVVECTIEIQAQRASTPPKVFTQIHLHYTVCGHSLRMKQVERAIQLSKDKYCSVSKMLESSAQITTSFDLTSSVVVSDEGDPNL